MKLHSFVMGRDTVPLFEVLRWCKHQRFGATEGTPRHATYTLLIQTLEHLGHAEDLTEIPAHKFERLALKARKLAGWETTRPKQAATQPIPPDHRHCPKCDQIKPDKEFLQRATDRQREVYGWHNKRTVRWVASPYCKRCRTNAIKGKRRKEKTKLLVQSPHFKLIYTLQQTRRSTLRSLSTATDPHAQTFYETKLQALHHAIQTLNHLLDTDPSTPIPSASDWTRLLEENHRQTLLDLHNTLILQRLPGRSPTL